MKYTIHIGDKPVTFEHEDFDTLINVDDLTKIDTSNLFGEAVTISAAVNRIGLLKAEVESLMAHAKLDYKIFEGQYIGRMRKQAADPENRGFFLKRVGNEDVKVKLTQGALDTCFEDDEDYIDLKKAFITAEKNFNSISSLYWACQDKSRKLNGLINGTTPADFIAGVIEGKINGILITK